MKIILLITLCVFLLNSETSGQEDVKVKHEAYYNCVNFIPKFDAPFKDTTKEAFQNCSDYLQKYPNDDPRLVEYAQSWIRAYEKINAYLESVNNGSGNSQDWTIMTDELTKEIPVNSKSEGAHKVEISRQFADPIEDKLLKIAEAVYPNPKENKAELFKNWRYYSQQTITLPLGEPRWWSGSFDTILSTRIVTTGAVLYYLEVTDKLKNNNNMLKEESFTFQNTNLKYWSFIKKFEKYERNGKTFENVYVADINLTWGQICGGLCGHGFTRNKVVVLNEKGNVLDLFLDAKVNFSSWVS